MESYINILKKVNRLDLEDLLDYIYDKSYDIMNLLLRESKFSLHKLNVKPWELEVLATLVLLKKSFDKKYYHLSIRDKEGDKILKSILYSIKSYEDEIIEERKLIDERFNKWFTLMLNSQLSYQLDSRIFLFRNKYLFNFNDVDFEENHINIKKSFEEKIGINYNDTLIVNKTADIDNGNIVLAINTSAGFLRQYYSHANPSNIILTSDPNDTNKEIFNRNDVQIVGKVVSIYRKF